MHLFASGFSMASSNRGDFRAEPRRQGGEDVEKRDLATLASRLHDDRAPARRCFRNHKL